MPQRCRLHSDPICTRCADTPEVLPDAVCDLCQATCKAPFGSVTNGHVCCVRCMEMAADVLRAYSARQEIAIDDRDWWKLLEGAEQGNPIDGEDCQPEAAYENDDAEGESRHCHPGKQHARFAQERRLCGLRLLACGQKSSRGVAWLVIRP